MPDFDLDAASAAKGEVDGEDKAFTYRGERFVLPDEAPWGFVEAVFGTMSNNEAAFHGIRGLLGGDYERFVALQPPMAAIAELMSYALGAYGLRDVGESEASGSSSTGTSRRSRRTSNGATGSTSAKRSGGSTKASDSVSDG